MIIGITGARGRLGYEFAQRGYEVLGCDISDVDAVQEELARVNPDVIINCAGFTDVDGAEDSKNQDAVIRSNMTGVSVLRLAYNGYFVHISTAYVFDGEKPPYREGDACNPLNYYATTKLAGESAAIMRQPTLVVRTIDLFGRHHHPDKVTSLIEALRGGNTFTLPTNLYGQPTYIPWVADSIIYCVSQGFTGVLHLAGYDQLSKFNFGRLLAERFGYNPELIQPTTNIKGADRPLNPLLDMGKAISHGLEPMLLGRALDLLYEEKADLHGEST